MRKTPFIVSILTVMFCTNAYPADFEISACNVEYREEFNRFQGTCSTLPAGFSVSKYGTDIMLQSDADFKGVSTGMVSVGGCYAWNISSNNNALGFQPTADKFSPGIIFMVISNSTGAVCKRVQLSADILYLNNEDRSSLISIEISSDGLTYTAVTNGVYMTPSIQDAVVCWKSYHYARELRLPKGVYLNPGDRLWIRWYSNDAAGSQSRDEIGIDNVAIMLKKEEGGVLILR